MKHQVQMNVLQLEPVLKEAFASLALSEKILNRITDFLKKHQIIDGQQAVFWQGAYPFFTYEDDKNKLTYCASSGEIYQKDQQLCVNLPFRLQASKLYKELFANNPTSFEPLDEGYKSYKSYKSTDGTILIDQGVASEPLFQKSFVLPGQAEPLLLTYQSQGLEDPCFPKALSYQKLYWVDSNGCIAVLTDKITRDPCFMLSHHAKHWTVHALLAGRENGKVQNVDLAKHALNNFEDTTYWLVLKNEEVSSFEAVRYNLRLIQDKNNGFLLEDKPQYILQENSPIFKRPITHLYFERKSQITAEVDQILLLPIAPYEFSIRGSDHNQSSFSRPIEQTFAENETAKRCFAELYKSSGGLWQGASQSDSLFGAYVFWLEGKIDLCLNCIEAAFRMNQTPQQTFDIATYFFDEKGLAAADERPESIAIRLHLIYGLLPMMKSKARSLQIRSWTKLLTKYLDVQNNIPVHLHLSQTALNLLLLEKQTADFGQDEKRKDPVYIVRNTQLSEVSDNLDVNHSVNLLIKALGCKVKSSVLHQEFVAKPKLLRAFNDGLKISFFGTEQQKNLLKDKLSHLIGLSTNKLSNASDYFGINHSVSPLRQTLIKSSVNTKSMLVAEQKQEASTSYFDRFLSTFLGIEKYIEYGSDVENKVLAHMLLKLIDAPQSWPEEEMAAVLERGKTLFQKCIESLLQHESELLRDTKNDSRYTRNRIRCLKAKKEHINKFLINSGKNKVHTAQSVIEIQKQLKDLLSGDFQDLQSIEDFGKEIPAFFQQLDAVFLKWIKQHELYAVKTIKLSKNSEEKLVGSSHLPPKLLLQEEIEQNKPLKMVPLPELLSQGQPILSAAEEFLQRKKSTPSLTWQKMADLQKARKDDPLMQEEVQLLKESLAEEDTSSLVALLGCNDQQVLHRLKHRLEENVTTPKKRQERWQDLLTLANNVDQNSPDYLNHRLSRGGLLTREISHKELLRAWMANDLQRLAAKHPGFTDDKVQELDALLGPLLLDEIVATQTQKALNEITALQALRNKNQPEEESLRQVHKSRLEEILAACRYYDPQTNRPLLVFEYQQEICLRHNQLSSLIEMIDEDKTYFNAVHQLAMGAGKTKVLLPLLAYYHAHRQRLPLIVVPAPLFEVNRSDLQRTCTEAFGQECLSFLFSREDTHNLEQLRYLSRLLEQAQASESAIITTAASLQGLRLGYFSALEQLSLNTSSANNCNKASVELLGNMLRLLRQKGVAIIDEADQALGVSYEVNFSTGSPRFLPECLQQISQIIYEGLLEDPQLQKIVCLRDNQQSLLSSELYEQSVKPLLINWICQADNLQRLASNEKTQADIKKALQQLTDDYAASGDLETDRLIFYLKTQLDVILPSTLSRNGGEHYGRRADNLIGFATPYLKGTPLRGSEFGNFFESINYTLQSLSHRRQGLSPVEVLKGLKQLEQEAYSQEEEDLQRSATSKACQIEATMKAGSCLEGLPRGAIETVDDPRLLAFTKNLNDDPKRLLAWAMTFILPNIPIFEESLQGTAHDLVSLFQTVQGFSGTVHNHKTYGAGVKTSLNSTMDKIVCKNLFDVQKTQILEVADDDRSFIMKNCQRLGQMHAWIDVGGWERGRPNAQVAKELLVQLHGAGARHIEGILYFDNATNHLALYKGEEHPVEHLPGSDRAMLNKYGIDTNKLFTYYDQAHTTGVDLPQPDKACAFVTVSERMPLRDLSQGVLRMRQLDRGQGCLIVVQKAARQLMKHTEDPLTMLSIYAHALWVQCDNLAKEKVKAFKQALSVKVDTLVLTVLSALPPEEAAAVSTTLRACYVQNNPLETVSGKADKIDTLEALHSFHENFCRKVKKVLAQLAAKIKSADPVFGSKAILRLHDDLLNVTKSTKPLLADVEKVLGKMPLETLVNHHLGQNVEVEIQQEMEQNIEEEKEDFSNLKAVSSRNIDFCSSIHYVNDKAKPANLCDEQEVIPIKYLWQEASRKIDDNIYASQIFYKTVSANDIGGFCQKPVYFFVVDASSDGCLKFIAISLSEANKFLNEAQHSQEQRSEDSNSLTLCGINGDIVCTESPKAQLNTQQEAFRRGLAQMQYLNQNHVGRFIGLENDLQRFCPKVGKA